MSETKEMTAGQRIAAEFDFDTNCAPGTNKALAAAIDEAIADVREEERNKMCAGLSRAGIDYTYEWPSFDRTFAHFNIHSPQWKEWKEQLAAKEAEWERHDRESERLCKEIAIKLGTALGRIEAKDAECAAMRSALTRVDEALASHGWTIPGASRKAIQAALASNAGADLLARLRAAEEKAARAKENKNESLI